MIKFTKVSYKNFFSVGNQPIVIQLDRSPTTAIIGKNGNGKSTLIEAIHFALFGKPFRNINKPAVINSINNGHCVVEIEFSTGTSNYKIIRGLKPTIFEIYKDGNLINQDAASRDYQVYLEDNILGGMNEYVFKQVIAIGKANYLPFMQLPAAKRREVIEELLDIKIFSNMLDVAKLRVGEIKENLKDIDVKIQLCEEKIKINEKNLADQKSKNISKKIELEQILKTNENKISDLLLQISEIQGKRNVLFEKHKNSSKVSDSIRQIEKTIAVVKKTKQQHEETIEFFEKNDTCPTCKQGIDHVHKKTLQDPINNTLVELGSTLDKQSGLLETQKRLMVEYDKIKQKIDELDKKVFEKQTEIKSLQSTNKIIMSDISNISNVQTQETSVLDGLKNELLLLKQNKLDMSDNKQYYDVIMTMLKDGGIKTKIIKKYIPLMNKYINDYLGKFGLPIQFTLDDEFNEVIKSRYRDAFCYANFSEGEKQRIDLALLFTWRSIAKSKNTVNTNLLFLDETFDSSLDGDATDELLNILTGMDKSQNIFIISHKADITDKMRSVIEFEKQGNFTRIK